MTGAEFYSVNNDTDAESRLLLMLSTRLDDPPLEKLESFRPAP